MLWYFVVRGGSKSTPATAQTLPSRYCRFANLTGDKENEYFPTASREISTRSQTSRLRSSLGPRFSFKGKDVNVRKIVRSSTSRRCSKGAYPGRNQLRVSPADGALDGYHLWSRITTELKNIFAVEESWRAPSSTAEPADRRSRACRSRRPMRKRMTCTCEGVSSGTNATRKVGQGAALFDRRSRRPDLCAGTRRTRRLLNLSIDYGGARPDALPKAKMHALKALELDDSLAEAHLSLASIIERDYDWTTSERDSSGPRAEAGTRPPTIGMPASRRPGADRRRLARRSERSNSTRPRSSSTR